MQEYVIGVDFGTLSVRALLMDVSEGKELGTAEFVYPHGIITSDSFPQIAADKDMALQHPQDYLDGFYKTVRSVIEKCGVDPARVRGIGIDFTSSTVLPVLEDGTPLCFLDAFQQEPQAYVKLWNHHSAQPEADAITELARQRGESWLKLYGGKVSAEWLMPKLWEVLHKAPAVFDATARYLEAGDWLVWQLTGKECHSSCMAGYKALWQKESGYPSNEFWKALDPRLGDLVGTKISEAVQPVGTAAGALTREAAEKSGLVPGIAVTAPVIDAHAAVPAAGITGPEKLMLILGTSGCHHVLSKRLYDVPGICGCVADGIVPGYVAYEGGQSGFGDCFDWFVKNCVPEAYTQEAQSRGMNIFSLLNEKAAKKKVGENGLVVLDWWNGNRTPLADFDLSGMILGLTLKTKPEDIYRGILEAAAFGTKAIVDLLTDSGVAIREIRAAGGISQKNPFLMQIISDVLGMPVRVSESAQAGARGAAVFAAAAGGCFDSLEAAANAIADPCRTEYTPNPENTAKYALLYREYAELTAYFGKGINDVMKRLKKMQ